MPAQEPDYLGPVDYLCSPEHRRVRDLYRHLTGFHGQFTVFVQPASLRDLMQRLVLRPTDYITCVEGHYWLEYVEQGTGTICVTFIDAVVVKHALELGLIAQVPPDLYEGIGVAYMLALIMHPSSTDPWLRPSDRSRLRVLLQAVSRKRGRVQVTLKRLPCSELLHGHLGTHKCHEWLIKNGADKAQVWIA